MRYLTCVDGKLRKEVGSSNMRGGQSRIKAHSVSSQGKYEEAEEIHRQMLALKEGVVRTDEWQ